MATGQNIRMISTSCAIWAKSILLIEIGWPVGTVPFLRIQVAVIFAAINIALLLGTSSGYSFWEVRLLLCASGGNIN